MQKQGTARVQSEPFITFKNKTILFGVAGANNSSGLAAGEIKYCVGIETGVFVMRWIYIVGGVFVFGAVLILTVRINKHNIVSTARSVSSSTKKAKRAYNNYKKW